MSEKQRTLLNNIRNQKLATTN
jgi:hypothetical protein